MRPASSFMSFCVLFLAVAAFGAEAPAPPPVQAKIDQAIKDLGSDVWKVRQDAVETLVKIGPAAIPALKAAAEKATDSEIRTKASAALQQIESAGLIGASTITLQVKDAQPAEVFAEIARQARCEFATYPKNLWQQMGSRAITMDLKDVNFWGAFKEACEKAGVFPQQWGNDRRMTLFQGGNNMWSGPSVTTGPFLVVANRIHRSNSVELSNPANIQHDFQISLTVFCEPKIRVIQSSYNVKVDKAVDDKGNSLAVDAPGFDGMSTGNQWMWSLTARLNYPENAGRKIAVFKGTSRFLIQTQSEKLDIPDILSVKNKEVTVAGRRMLIKECKQNGQQYALGITFFRDGLSQADWNSIHSNGQALKLQDKEGRQLNPHGWGGGGGGDKMDYNYQFGRQNFGGEEGQVGEPFRLVWEIPTETREMNATFEFKDLPLP